MAINVFWDNSNIWLVGRRVCEKREPGNEGAFRIHFANLFSHVVGGRDVEYAFVGGSLPPTMMSYGGGSKSLAQRLIHNSAVH